MFPHDERLMGSHIEPEPDGPPAHLAETHPQYPEGFPSRADDALLGHWRGTDGVIVVEHHPHGYEVHVYPCYDFDGCDACSPDRGTSNPHVPEDGHDFRECQNRRGPIFTVAGDKPETVLAYLSGYGSEPHRVQLLELDQQREKEEQEARRIEREQTMRDEQEEARQAQVIPTVDERIEALAAEVAALRQRSS